MKETIQISWYPPLFSPTIILHRFRIQVGSRIGNPTESLADYSATKFCASMWTKEQSDEVQRIARETVPGIKTMAIPQSLQVEKGPDGVVEFLKEKWSSLVEQ